MGVIEQLYSGCPADINIHFQDECPKTTRELEDRVKKGTESAFFAIISPLDLRRVYALNLINTHLTEDRFADLAQRCVNLASLKLSETFSRIQRLEGLRVLQLDNTVIWTDFFPPNLTSLTMANSVIKVRKVKTSELPSSITELDLSRSKMRQAGLRSFCRLPLSKLNLSYIVITNNQPTSSLTDDQIRNLPGTLRHLTLVRNTFSAFLDHLEKLEFLSVSCCLTISLEGIKKYPRGLKVLDMAQLVLSDEMCVDSLPPNLTELNLSGCFQLSNAIFAHLARLPLRKLTLPSHLAAEHSKFTSRE